MRRLLLASWLIVAAAAHPAGQAPAPPTLTIESATPDPDTGTVTIAGSNFGPRPFVTLDLVPLALQLAIDARIIASAPVDRIPPGVYLLTVSRGPLPGESATFDLRIGPPAQEAPAQGDSSIQDLRPGPDAAAARVGDRVITVADVDREWQRVDPAGYLAASRELYTARFRILSDLVNRELLAREAATRGITVDALLGEELPKRRVAMPDTAVTSLYQSLGDRARGASLDQMRPALRAWLERKTEPEMAKMTYVEELGKVSTRVDTFLEPPRVVVTNLPDDPVLGPARAPVEIAVFADFQGSGYARFAPSLGRVSESFGSRVRFVFKHLPLIGAESVAAAEAGVCANAQGKFWGFHDTLLGEAGALDRARFRRVAADVGADAGVFERCLDGIEARDRVRDALQEARRYGVSTSPAFIVNGRLAPPPPSFLPPFGFFKRLIEEELQRQATATSPPR